ncbi:MAG: glycosyltransferase family 4 protein [Bacteroidota bacterium]
MKILVISNYQDAYNSVRPEGVLFIGLKKMGVEVTMMTQANAPFVAEFRKSGISIIDFHPAKKIDLQAIRLIRRTLLEDTYDILHLFNSKAISNGVLAAIGLPVKVLAYRGVIGGSSWLNPNAYLKHLHPRIDGITTVSKAVQRYMQQQVWWNPKKVSQFYKGQDVTWYQDIHPIDLSKLNVPKSAFIVTCVANNRTWKGIRYLIEAAQFLPKQLPIHFLLVGNKMDTPKNLALIKKSDYAPHFHLLGYRNDVLSILAASHVYVQPSLSNKEGLGKAILEAMSLGVPPIVTDSGGPIEFVQHEISGLIVPSKNAGAIGKGILRLYKEIALRAKMREEVQAVIKEKMGVEQSILSLKGIYEAVLAARLI